MTTLSEIRVLCALYWNPIGVPMAPVADEATLGYRPLPADEYDTYLGYVRERLKAGADDGELLAYLDLVEREYLTVASPPGAKERFVAELRRAAAAP